MFIAHNENIFPTSKGGSADNLGFTLVELMIVVAILAILGAIAIPQYQNYIRTSKLGSANAVLEQFPVLLESFRAENGRFPLTNVYTYTEAANGAVTTNSIVTGNGLVVGGGAGLRDFAPRDRTRPAAQGILFDYSLTITNSGLVTEAATFTATGVREAAGINSAGAYQ